ARDRSDDPRGGRDRPVPGPQVARRGTPGPVDRDRGGALVRAAPARVPLGPRAAQGGDRERPVDRRRLRRRRRGVPVGWGDRLLGLDGPVAIVSFVPMVMFAILFGLSMDYEVFLLSRVREEYLVDRDTVESVATGI